MPRWTPQSRAKQRALINQVKPWQRSTGPRTEAGKHESCRNGNMHPPRAPGTHPAQVRAEIRKWRGLLKLQIKYPFGGVELLQGVALKIYALEVSLGGEPEAVAKQLIATMHKGLK